MFYALCMIYCASTSDHNRQLVNFVINYFYYSGENYPMGNGILDANDDLIGNIQNQRISEISALKYNNQLMSLQNPYEDLYRAKVTAPVSGFTMKQAEQMATQMSLIYHAFGGALKDMVRLLSILYSTERPMEQIDSRFTRQIIQEEDESVKSSISQKIKVANEQNQLKLDQKAINQPDFSKYMIKFPQQPTKKRSALSQKFMEKEIKSIKASNDPKPIERTEVVRGKRERETLQGYSCTVCHDFYKALGQDYNDSSGRDKLCNDCSRHRSNLPPTNFHMDFSQQFGFQD